MSSSSGPRESYTKSAVQLAVGGAPYDPDYIANGTKEERIAYMRAVNAKAVGSAHSTGTASSSGAGGERGSGAGGRATGGSALSNAQTTPAPVKPKVATVASASSSPARAAAATTQAPSSSSLPVSAKGSSSGDRASSATANASASGTTSSKGANAARYATIAAGIAAGVAVTGLAAYAASSLMAMKRQAALVAALERGFADSDKCHLFVSPRTAISAHRNPACTEVEAFLRLARVAYTAHFVEYGSDLSGALTRLDDGAQSRMMRASPTEAAASGTEGDRLSAEVADDLSYLLEGGALPVLVYRDEAICVGSRTIIEYCMTAFDIKIDAVFPQADLAVGASLRKMVAYSVPLYLRRTLCDHPQTWALVEGAQRGSSTPALTGWCHVWKDCLCRLPMRYRIAHHSAIGSQSRAEYEACFERDVSALEQLLGQKAFMLGFTPSSYDCAVYAMLLPLMNMDETMVSSLNGALASLRKSKPLKDYMSRVAALTFPDLDALLKNAAWMGRAGEEETYDYHVTSAPAAGAATATSSALTPRSRAGSVIGAPREVVNTRAAEASSMSASRRSTSPRSPLVSKSRAAPPHQTTNLDDVDEV